VDSQKYGALLYVDGRVVREGWGEATDWQIADLPFEQVLAATLENDSCLWVLADGRLAVVDLPSGTTEEVAEIESPTRWGKLLMIEGRHSIAYTAGVDDNSTLLGCATCMGLYDIQTQQTRPLTRLPGTLRLLGSSLQQGTLYAVRLGGDGGFAAILSINLESGMVSTAIELQLPGFAWASESPDGRRIAVIEMEMEEDPTGIVLAVYNTAEPDVPPLAFDLPQQPSHIYSAIWTPDSRHLYFVLRAGPVGGYGSGDEKTYGLWRLDVVTGELTEITSSVQADSLPVVISPDGRAIVLAGSYSFDLVDLQTGAVFPLQLPTGAIVVAWLYSSARPE